MKGEGAGKGDTPRPLGVPEAVYNKNFEAAFGKKVPWWATKEHQEWVKQSKSERKAADARGL